MMTVACVTKKMCGCHRFDISGLDNRLWPMDIVIQLLVNCYYTVVTIRLCVMIFCNLIINWYTHFSYLCRQTMTQRSKTDKFYYVFNFNFFIL